MGLGAQRDMGAPLIVIIYPIQAPHVTTSAVTKMDFKFLSFGAPAEDKERMHRYCAAVLQPRIHSLRFPRS